MLPRPRSFLVDAVTFGAELRPDGAQRAAWHLGRGVFLCTLQVTRAPEAAEPSSPDVAEPSPSAAKAPQTAECDPDAYDVHATERSLDFIWPEYSRILVTAGGDGGVIVDFDVIENSDQAGGPASTGESRPMPREVDLGGELTLTENSRLVIPRDVFAAVGGLPFSGEVTVGAIPDAGVRGLLQSGNYSIREALPLRGNPVSVASGELHAGDRVSFVHPDHEYVYQNDKYSTFGFVTALAQDAGDMARVPFRLVAYTEPALTRMRIERFSGRPTEVKSSWTDRALRDPLLLGLTAILTLSALLISMLTGAFDFLTRKNADPVQPGKKEPRSSSEEDPDQGSADGKKLSSSSASHENAA